MSAPRSPADAATALRAVRRSVGLSQDRWAAWLNVSRRTVQRWELGDGLPDALAEAAIVAVCAEKRLASDELVEVLTAARGRVGGDGRETRDGRNGRDSARQADLVGRAGELDAIRRAVATSRLVTLTGPGGVGKTSLAWQIDALSGRRHVVELASLREADQVPAAVGVALGSRATRTRSWSDAVLAQLGSEPGLLVLDNFEHVMDAAPFVAQVVDACPALTVLVTSRVALRLPGEHVIVVVPLAPSPAVELFARRARAADPSFALDHANEGAVSTLCAALDGLPLAIELAAARVRALPPHVLVQRIDQRLRLLTGGTGRPARHETFRAAIAWSVELLDARTVRLFERLAVFRGGWTLDAAEAVGGLTPLEPVDVLACLAELVEHHLVLPPDEASRFAMLETLREDAADRLAHAADATAVHDAHRAWCLNLAREHARLVRSPVQHDALARLDAEHANLMSALADAIAGSDADVAYRLAAALGGYWDARSLLAEAMTWTERVLRVPAPDARRRDGVVQWAGYFAFLLGNSTRARELAEDSIGFAHSEHLDGPLGYALLRLGQVEIESGELDAGAEHLRQSAAALERAGDRWGAARPINNLGEVARELGDLGAAESFHRAALEICREVGDDSSLPNVLSGLGHVLVARGDLDGAAHAAAEALVHALRLGNRIGEAYAREVLALVAVARGAWADARAELDAASSLRDELGAPVERRDRATIAAAALVDSTDRDAS